MIYSYTQISQYLTCPRRYRHRFLDGWQEKDTRAAMLFGRAFERALATYFLRRRGGCAVSGMEALSRSEARVLAWEYLGPHARARHSTAQSLLPGRSRPHSSAPPQPAAQVCPAAFGPKRVRGVHRCHRTVGRPRLSAGVEDHFEPLPGKTGWIVSLRPAADLLLLDHRSFRSRPGGLCAQAPGRDPISAHHYHRCAAPR